MPALTVSVDGVHLATVSTDGYDVLTVHAGGTRVDDDLATLDVSGGTYPEEGQSTYLIWVCDFALQPGQVVEVSLLETASTSHRGKTIKELFSGETPAAPVDFKPTTEMFAKLRDQPKLHDKYSFRLVTSLGTVFVGETFPEEHGFGFSVEWNSFHPERARLSLHSYTLDDLESHGPMKKHVEKRMHYGDSVRFELVA